MLFISASRARSPIRFHPTPVTNKYLISALVARSLTRGGESRAAERRARILSGNKRISRSYSSSVIAGVTLIFRCLQRATVADRASSYRMFRRASNGIRPGRQKLLCVCILLRYQSAY